MVNDEQVTSKVVSSEVFLEKRFKHGWEWFLQKARTFVRTSFQGLKNVPFKVFNATRDAVSYWSWFGFGFVAAFVGAFPTFLPTMGLVWRGGGDLGLRVGHGG